MSNSVRKNRNRRARRARKREERQIVKGEESKVVSAITEMNQARATMGEKPDDDAMLQRQWALIQLLQIYPAVPLLRGLAACRDAEWHIGRLHLVGALTKKQLTAAEYIAKVRDRYSHMINPNGSPKAVDIGKVSGGGHENLSEAALRSYQRTKRQYEKVEKALDRCGGRIKDVVLQALNGTEDVPLDLLARGLDAVYEVVGRR